jgi:hypothetical protein
MNLLQTAIAFGSVLIMGIIIGKAFGYKQALQDLATGNIELNIYAKQENITTKILSITTPQKPE